MLLCGGELSGEFYYQLVVKAPNNITTPRCIPIQLLQICHCSQLEWFDTFAKVLRASFLIGFFFLILSNRFFEIVFFLKFICCACLFTNNVTTTVTVIAPSMRIDWRKYFSNEHSEIKVCQCFCNSNQRPLSTK